MAKDEGVIERDILVLKIQSADAEMAPFLALAGGEKVVVYRERRRQTDQALVARSDRDFSFWFADALPEGEQRDRDVYQLMRQRGTFPLR